MQAVVDNIITLLNERYSSLNIIPGTPIDEEYEVRADKETVVVKFADMQPNESRAAPTGTGQVTQIVWYEFQVHKLDQHGDKDSDDRVLLLAADMMAYMAEFRILDPNLSEYRVMPVQPNRVIFQEFNPAIDNSSFVVKFLVGVEVVFGKDIWTDEDLPDNQSAYRNTLQGLGPVEKIFIKVNANDEIEVRKPDNGNT